MQNLQNAEGFHLSDIKLRRKQFMLYTIRNEALMAQVSSSGAQLMSLEGKNHTQYLWRGNPRYWSDRSLTIFSICSQTDKRLLSLQRQVLSYADSCLDQFRIFLFLSRRNPVLPSGWKAIRNSTICILLICNHGYSLTSPLTKNISRKSFRQSCSQYYIPK